MKPSRPSLIIVGHGSSQSEGAEVAVRAHAAALRQSNRFGQVLTHFLKQDKMPDPLPEGEVFILPFFMSDGYFVKTKIPEIFELQDFERHEQGRDIYQCDAIGVDPGLTDLMVQMIDEELQEFGRDPKECAVLLAAHGSAKNSASANAARLQAERLLNVEKVEHVEVAFLEEMPSIAQSLDQLGQDFDIILVIGLFASEGPHAMEDVPNEIMAWQKSQKSADDQPLIHYSGVVGTRYEILKLIQLSISRRAGTLG